MPIACPLCCTAWRDLFALALHVEDMHPGEQHRVTVAVAPESLPEVPRSQWPSYPQAFPGVDIDQVHRTYQHLSRAAACEG